MNTIKVSVITAALLSITLAGCLGDNTPMSGDYNPDSQVQVNDPNSFFNGSWYDANLFDLGMLSQPIHAALPVEEVWVEATDGTMLHNGVYRPDTPNATPVFINFSPYHGDTAEAGGDGFGQYLIDNFVPRGYTIVLSSIRGTGHSEGCFEVASDREAMDLSEVVDFFAEQVWSNGMIAAGGKSYDSTTQNAAIAKFPTENLKAVFHVSGITDMYEYTYHAGLPARADAAAFTSRYAVGQGTDEYGAIPLTSGFQAGSDPTDEDPESLQRLADDASCPANVENIVFPAASMADGSKTDYWMERDWASVINETTWNGSIFFYHGYHDWNVQPSHIQPWLDNLPEDIDAKVWLHQDRENLGHLYPMRADWNLTMLRWLDHELKGIDTGFWLEPRMESQGSDRLWRYAEEIPASANEVERGLTSDNVLMGDEREAIRYTGQMAITATVTPMVEDSVFSAQLFDVDENGNRTWRNEATLRVLYRNGLEAPEPVTPGTPIEITAHFYPQDDVLEVGHKWIIEFQTDPLRVITTPAALAGLTVDESSAVIRMDVLDADDVVLLHQPVPTNCFAC